MASRFSHGGSMIVNYEDLVRFAEFRAENETDFDLQLNAAQEIAENYLGYSIEKKTYTKTLDGSGLKSINLGIPVISIASLSVDDEPISIDEFYTAKEFIFWKENRFPHGEQNIFIEFDGGFELVPALIKLTVLRIAAVLVSEGSGTIGVSSVSDPNTGSRTFMERTFKRYLQELNSYRVSPW